MAATEFALTWSPSCGTKPHEGAMVPADLCTAGGGLVPELGLDTAVFMSLFFDARIDDVAADKDHPSGDPVFGTTDHRGWWGAELLREAGVLPPGQQYGSRLWRYRRAKLTARTLVNITRACDEALDWLVSSNIAESVEVSVEVTTAGRADILILITRAKDVPVRFSFVWDSMEGGSRGNS